MGEYAAAAAILREIQDDPQQDLCECQRHSRAPTTAAEAREFVAAFRNLPPGDNRSKMIRALATAGELDEARKLAALSSDSVHLRAIIAEELAAENKMSEAEKELEGINDENVHGMIMISMADRLLAHGDLKGAVEYLDRSPRSWVETGTSDIRMRTALACIKAGRFDDAVRIGSHSEGRAALIQELCRLNRLDDARKIVADGQAPGITADLILAMCRHGQADAALAAMKPPHRELSPLYCYPATLAETWATHDDPKIAAAWARKLEPPEDRCAALLGVARAILVKHEP